MVSVMRLWFRSRDTEPDLDLDIVEISDKFLVDKAEDIYLDNITSVKEVLRWWLNQQGWLYDENEFDQLYELVLVEGEWGKSAD